MTRRQILWTTGLAPVLAPAAIQSLRDCYSAERHIFALVNQERARRGLTTLHWNEAVSDVARGHSFRMASEEFFAHQDPDGGDLKERLERGRVAWLRCGENIFRERGYPNVAEPALSGWLHSPGHYANMMQPAFTMTGLGVSVSRSDTVYVTQVFIRHA